MATTKKSSGLATLAKMATAVKKPAKKATTAKKKVVKKNIKKESNLATTPLKKVRVERRNDRTNLSSLSIADYQDKIARLAESITLKGQWDNLSSSTVDQIDLADRDLVDVSTESEQIQNNFNVLSNQISILSTFVTKLDYKSRAFENTIKTGVIKVASETAKNQVNLVKTINTQLKTFDNTIDKFQSRIDTHDKQLDALYAEIRNAKKTTAVSDFLANSRAQKKSLLDPKTEDDINSIDPKNNPGGINWSSIIKGAGVVAGATVTGGYTAYRAGKYINTARKAKAAKIAAAAAAERQAVKQIIANISRLSAKIGIKRSIIIFARYGASAVVKGLIGAAAGATGIGGIVTAGLLGWALYDLYDLYEALTKEAGESVDVDEKNSILKNKNTGEIVFANPKDEIKIISSENIFIQSKKKLELKADHIILDAQRIEFKGKTNLGNGVLPEGVTEQEKAGPNPNFRPRGNPSTGQLVTQQPKDVESIRPPSTQSGPGGPAPGTAPYRGRGSTGNQSIKGVPASPIVPKKESMLTKLLGGRTNGENKTFLHPRDNPNINPEMLDHFKKNPTSSPEGLPAAFRTNNPGAISITGNIDSSFAAKQPGFAGAIPRPKDEGGYYAKFATPEHGIAAQATLLKKYAAKGKDTVATVLSDWAAMGQGQYIQSVAKELGVSANEKLDFNNPEMLQKFMMAQAKFESGSKGILPYKEDVYDRAVKGQFSSVYEGEGSAKVLSIANRNEELIKKSRQKRSDVAFNKKSLQEQNKQNKTDEPQIAAAPKSLAVQTIKEPSAGGAPTQIIEQARKIALEGGPVAVDRFMREQGHPKNTAWCGDFAASIVQSVGGEIPKNPQIASNWRNFGTKVDGAPQPGDIAVRKPGGSRRGSGQTGAPGSHVTLVNAYDGGNTFNSIGGNQGKFNSNQSMARYDFYRSKGTDVEKKVTVLPKTAAAEDQSRKIKDKVNKTLYDIREKRANIKPIAKKVTPTVMSPGKQEKQNVASNGSISGGKRVQENVASNGAISGGKPKMVDEPVKKKQPEAQSEPQVAQSSGSKSSSSSQTYEPKGAQTSSYDNSADSIPPGPADSGYGDYSLCFV